jgi:hypothetical protein
LSRRSKEERLADLKRNRRNRKIEEVQDLLAAYGFIKRSSKNEQGGVWSRGSRTVTLPRPHGGTRTLLPIYIAKVLVEIELAEQEAKDADRGDEVN